jgi:hypothetical protein
VGSGAASVAPLYYVSFGNAVNPIPAKDPETIEGLRVGLRKQHIEIIFKTIF